MNAQKEGEEVDVHCPPDTDTARWMGFRTQAIIHLIQVKWLQFGPSTFLESCFFHLWLMLLRRIYSDQLIPKTFRTAKFRCTQKFDRFTTNPNRSFSVSLIAFYDSKTINKSNLWDCCFGHKISPCYLLSSRARHVTDMVYKSGNSVKLAQMTNECESKSSYIVEWLERDSLTQPSHQFTVQTTPFLKPTNTTCALFSSKTGQDMQIASTLVRRLRQLFSQLKC